MSEEKAVVPEHVLKRINQSAKRGYKQLDEIYAVNANAKKSKKDKKAPYISEHKFHRPL